MRGHAHHGAFAVAHQNVVTDPDFDLTSVQGVRHVETGGDALLFHRRHVGFGNGALRAFGDEGFKFGLTLGKALGERVLGGNRDERHAHDRIGTGRVNAQFLFFTVDCVGERKIHAHGLADPVFLHAANLFGPPLQFGKVVEEFLRVLRDAEVVPWDFTLFHLGTGAPTVAVDHLFVGENGLIHRIPVHDLGFAVADTLFEHLEEHPLVPAVVLGFAGRYFARPVKGEPQGTHLFLHVGDVLERPLRRRHFLT